MCFSEASLSMGASSESKKDPPIDVAGLNLLLNDAVFAKEFVPMVRHLVFIYMYNHAAVVHKQFIWINITSTQEFTIRMGSSISLSKIL